MSWLSSNGPLGSLADIVSAVIAMVAAIYVWLEYRRTQRWRKGDLAAALMAKLDTVQELAFATQALDWGRAPIMVPERYRPLLKWFGKPDDAVLDHDTRVMARALEPVLHAEIAKSAQGLIYRHCFDKLFDHLENVGRLMASNQIDRTGLDGLEYWVKRIACYEYAPGGTDGREVFQPALAVFGYHRIPALGRKLGVSDWSVYDRTRCKLYIADTPDTRATPEQVLDAYPGATLPEVTRHLQKLVDMGEVRLGPDERYELVDQQP